MTTFNLQICSEVKSLSADLITSSKTSQGRWNEFSCNRGMV